MAAAQHRGGPRWPWRPANIGFGYRRGGIDDLIRGAVCRRADRIRAVGSPGSAAGIKIAGEVRGSIGVLRGTAGSRELCLPPWPSDTVSVWRVFCLHVLFMSWLRISPPRKVAHAPIAFIRHTPSMCRIRTTRCPQTPAWLHLRCCACEALRPHAPRFAQDTAASSRHRAPG